MIHCKIKKKKVLKLGVAFIAMLDIFILKYVNITKLVDVLIIHSLYLSIPSSYSLSCCHHHCHKLVVPQKELID